MNPLDWLLAALLAYSVLRATLRGFFRETFALVGLFLGFFLACWNYRSVALDLQALMPSLPLVPPLAQLLAFLLVLALTALAAALLGKLLSKTASALGLGLLDRLLGALFGVLRGTLLAFALLFAATAFLPAAPWMQTQIATSSLAPYFLRAVHAVSFVMPTDLRQRWLDGLNRLQHTSPPSTKPGVASQTGDAAGRPSGI